jgi:putative ABC transport system permease protein
VRSSSRTETVEQMTRAFELNLTALSLLALVVGMFLIYNTTTFSVVQRRGLIGRMRAVGVSRREVFVLVAGEAALIGVLGTALGLLLGLVLGQGLVRLVTQTINDLYFVLSVRGLEVPAWVLVKGAALGLGTTLLAAYFPAREAATAAPTAVLQRSEPEVAARRRAPRLALLGLALALVGGAVLVWSGTSIALSYVALLFVLLAFALGVPLAALAFVRAVRPLAGSASGMIGRMATNGIAQTLSRTAVAIAALSVALAATIGVGVMVQSFRGTVVTWLDNALRADVFISPPSLVFRRIDATLDGDFALRVQQSRLAEAVAVGHRVDARIEGEDADLFASTFPAPSEETFRFKEGDREEAFAAFRQREGLLISEPFAFRFGVALGDSVRIETDRGPRSFRVAGVYYDYGSDLGVSILSRPTFDRYFDDDGVSTLAVYLRDGVDAAEAVDAFRALAPPGQEVVIRSNRTLREASMEVFDRTFVITNVLRLLAVVVAFIGVLTALMALALERARELAVMRAIGFTPGQVRGYVTLQTALMGALAGILSIPLGLVLALVLVHVINKRSFGWTLQFELSPGVLLQALALAVFAAVVAGLYPAWKMSRTKPDEALRAE